MNHVILLSESVLDIPGTLSRLGGDKSLFVDLIDFFVIDAPQYMEDLQKAANAKDAAQVKWKAHTLKGLVAGCGGSRATAAAQLVEVAAQSNDLDGLPSLIDSLQNELQLLLQSLVAYRSQIASGANANSRPR